MNRLRIGSRESALALRQTQTVIRSLEQRHPEISYELIPIKTTGDQILDRALAKIGDKGLFTKELENALIQGEIDLAVHSLKDLPGDLPEGCCLAAVTARIEARDVLISRQGEKFDQLPRGAVLGTSSLRRKASLRRVRPDLRFVDIRGNIETRIRKMQSEGLDGIILAAAGLIRMNYEQLVAEYLPPELSLPAVGQGILGIETRVGDLRTIAVIASIHDQRTMLIAEVERAFLQTLGGGCQIPMGALAEWIGGNIKFRGNILSIDGQQCLYSEKERFVENAEQAVELGRSVAEDILRSGADAILSECRQLA